MICKSFDIVLVPFPFTDGIEVKKRPAIILTTELFNTGHEQSICAMITSATHEKRPSDIDIQRLSEAGLTKPSRIRFKLFTLDNCLILGKLGRLAKVDQLNLCETMNEVFADLQD